MSFVRWALFYQAGVTQIMCHTSLPSSHILYKDVKCERETLNLCLCVCVCLCVFAYSHLCLALYQLQGMRMWQIHGNVYGPQNSTLTERKRESCVTFTKAHKNCKTLVKRYEQTVQTKFVNNVNRLSYSGLSVYLFLFFLLNQHWGW